MDKGTLNLKDNTAIEFEAAPSISAIEILSQNRNAMVATWEKLTMDNLSKVQVKNADGVITGNHTDLVLVSETSAIRADGTIATTYHLRKKTAVELLTERLEAVEESQRVQDGAISDLGDVTSVLAGQIDGGTI